MCCMLLMKTVIILLLAILFSSSLFSQGFDEYAEMHKTEKWLQAKGIKLRYIQSHDGYIVHYNCDSVPFLKKVIDDTIKIWTEAGNFAMDVSDVEQYISRDNFGKSSYIHAVLSDGRVTLSGMHETVFIFRHDSLYEIESGYEKEGPKLIFHPKMFTGGKTKVKLGKKYNYLQDQIVQERTWIENGVKCYTIRINNKGDGDETTYSYTFDEKIHFIYWEDCKSRTKQHTTSALKNKGDESDCNQSTLLSSRK